MTNGPQKYQIDPQVNDQFQSLFYDATANIRLAKKQQWNIGYYAVLLYSGILFLSQFTEDKIPFAVLLTAIGFGGIGVVWILQYWMIKYRDRLQNIRRMMSPEYQSITYGREGSTRLWHGSNIPLIITLLILVAGSVSVWALYLIPTVN